MTCTGSTGASAPVEIQQAQMLHAQTVHYSVSAENSTLLVLDYIYVKKLISLKHCVRSQITRLKLQKSFCDLEHGASL